MSVILRNGIIKRGISMSCLTRNLEKAQPEKSAPVSGASSNPSDTGSLPLMKVTDTKDKIALVWTKKYKSMAEVPNEVSWSAIDYAHSKCRIKIANYMSVGVVIGCLISVYYGKKKAKEGGHSLPAETLKLHEEYKKRLEESNK